MMTPPSGQLSTDEVYWAYKESCLAMNDNPLDRPKMGLVLSNIFPKCSRKTVRVDGKLTKVYMNLKYRTSHRSCTPIECTKYFENVSTCQEGNETTTVAFKTPHSFSGHSVVKNLIIDNTNKSWKLEVAGETIGLEELGINNTLDDMWGVFHIVNYIQLCVGQQSPKSVIVSTLKKEVWVMNGTKQNDRVRTPKCRRVVPITNRSTICRPCQLMTIKTTAQTPKIETEKTFKEKLQELIPHASPEFYTILENQKEVLAKSDPRGNRWSKEIISLCLTLYTRSPASYAELSSSNFLKLPSTRLLQLYKNCVPYHTGANQHQVTWMYKEANRLKISPEGRQGGLIFDEMSIQPDLQLVKSGNGNGTTLIGLENINPESNALNMLKRGNTDCPLADHVLQLVFLGFSGFRFPIAYYPTYLAASATDLNIIFWESVEVIESYGFEVYYTNMDGAITNRQFVDINFPQKNAKELNYGAQSPVNPQNSVFFVMDYSHVIKKVRNSLYSSSANGTRYLKLPQSECHILWKHWTDAYNWDKGNPLAIHRKLSRDHIFLDSASKMRNHLAEHVLDADMLQLMLEYKESLGEHGSHLSGTIELLKQTSPLISIFRDNRPITRLDDVRLQSLLDILSWFQIWEDNVNKQDNISNSIKSKMLLTAECRADLCSCIVGFVAMCKKRLKKHPGCSINPSRMNSDVIENNFSQQRSLHNGPSSNPNLAAYISSQQSIVLGQSTVSKKANSGGSNGASPFSFTTPGPLMKSRKRKVLQSTDQQSNKAIRTDIYDPV